MSRPMYETKGDLLREEAIIARVCKAWSCEARKNPCPPYKLDHSLFSHGRLVAMAEVKSRKVRYSTCKLSLHKFMTMVETDRLIPTFLIMAMPEGLYYGRASELKVVSYGWWEDRRARDITDMEPNVEFDWASFNKIGEAL